MTSEALQSGVEVLLASMLQNITIAMAPLSIPQDEVCAQKTGTEAPHSESRMPGFPSTLLSDALTPSFFLSTLNVTSSELLSFASDEQCLGTPLASGPTRTLPYSWPGRGTPGPKSRQASVEPFPMHASQGGCTWSLRPPCSSKGFERKDATSNFIVITSVPSGQHTSGEQPYWLRTWAGLWRMLGRDSETSHFECVGRPDDESMSGEEKRRGG